MFVHAPYEQFVLRYRSDLRSLAGHDLNLGFVVQACGCRGDNKDRGRPVARRPQVRRSHLNRKGPKSSLVIPGQRFGSLRHYPNVAGSQGALIMHDLILGGVGRAMRETG